MDKHAYRLYLAGLKAQGEQAQQAAAEHVQRRESLKTYRHRRSDTLKSLLENKPRGDSVEPLLATVAELEARERAFGK